MLFTTEDRIELRRPRIIVSILPIERQSDIREISGTAYLINVKRARKRGTLILAYLASLREIQRALRDAHTLEYDEKNPEEPVVVPLPDWLELVKSAFDRKKADELPPPRPGIDHAINL